MNTIAVPDPCPQDRPLAQPATGARSVCVGLPALRAPIAVYCFALKPD